MHEYCEKLTKKNKCLVESKRLANGLNVLKDQLKLRDNVTKNLESKLINSEDNLANAQSEIHNLKLELESSQQESKSLQEKLNKGMLLINLTWEMQILSNVGHEQHLWWHKWHGLWLFL